jgi:ubiquinone/menaquinone biosynthesis C-methylase UbiE
MSANIDQANAEFWNELCGSQLASTLGLSDHSPASLRKFDDAYFEMYPYLLPFIGPERWKGKKVLEIGLGFGSLGQRIAEAGAEYYGLDIAENPVQMTNQRMELIGRPKLAKVGSAKSIPFPNETFDAVVSIGCLHHTGDLQRCLQEVERVLKPGGAALVMVYNKFSYREWSRRPWPTLRSALIGSRKRKLAGLENAARGEYDANSKGESAPETVITSKSELRRMFRGFESIRIQKQNCDHVVRKQQIKIHRDKLLPTLGRWMGLDLYAEAVKSKATSARRAA